MQLTAVEGDLYLLGLVAPKYITDLKERGLSEEDILSVVVKRPYMSGTTSGDFW